jgi:hypothetical protein
VFRDEVQTTDQEMIPVGWLVVSGGVRWLLVLGGTPGLLLVGATDCSAATQTENIKHSE